MTTTLLIAYRMVLATCAARLARVAWLVFAIGVGVQSAFAQVRPSESDRSSTRSGTQAVRTATIHWQGVPLRDAIRRLEELFDESTFLDRRIDPTERVSLDIAASSVEQVLTPLAAEHGWGASRRGGIVYLGPANAARQLGAVAAARTEDVAKLPRSQRAAFERKRLLEWPRRTEPRALVTELVENNGWRLADAERIPHDLWSAGRLSGLTLAEQLTVLLIGFDLTFETRPAERTVRIVALEKAATLSRAETSANQPASQLPRPAAGATKQVYSLRVAEKPVGAVVRELARQLNWQIEFDEAAIRTAGHSLDARVSFAVKNVEQDELLDAVLRPAGLTFRREGERIKVLPR